MLFANKIRQLREEKQLLQRQLATVLEIDTPMFSKIERGDRRSKREQVMILAEILQVCKDELLALWLADQVMAVVADEKEIARKAWEMVNNNLNGKSNVNKNRQYR
ncbi:hypothetical protein EZS27_014036 [termite gut metagenome]|uniref:HTH cro/C1-type domain-containing protein n=1 Tax=termite gut metagenome TaxID=433724 RepID=A0A5J4RWE2_9ZZZZ